MDIFPAIDLQNGQCVRLRRGDFESATVYEADPLRQAKKFADAGASWLHVVDLDGTRDGKPQQLPVITALAQQGLLKVQVGGGIRDKATIAQLLQAGATRVVIGSLAVQEPQQVQEWLIEFGAERIVLAFDVRLDKNDNPEVLTHGWQNHSFISLWDALSFYKDSGLQTILCTDVDRDGMLTGTNHVLYRKIQEHWPQLNILASGGIKDQDDLMALAVSDVAGAIVGKAIYEGKIDLAVALKDLKEAKNAG
jgi:phosphoribosylformimino-5-aminoimidazole carboxamide ribotide isomerase